MTIDPWLSLGYDPRRLGAWLARSARSGGVFVVRTGVRVDGIVVVQPDVLLGAFIALVAARPEAAGKGVGRALVDFVAARTFVGRRWLYVSSDTRNRAAAAFYRKLGFTRVGRLPDLVRVGRTEILWRLGRPAAAS